MQNHNAITDVTDHLFRRESGKMVSVLTRIFGTENLETAEDVVQDTLLQALQVWKLKGIPDNPAGWLYRVAKNKAIDIIRRNRHSIRYDFNDRDRILLTSGYTDSALLDNFFSHEMIKDNQLKMMFACCHPGLSNEQQITLILKTLCGFSTPEIARAFLTSEDNISKRLYRSKEFFRREKIRLEIPSPEVLNARTHVVLNSIYLLFNEGYNSAAPDELIRKDVIGEAMMLCRLITENELINIPESYALMALMCFHASRTDSRLTPEGNIVLLPDQDRSRWNSDLINSGNMYLNKAASGERVSTYHIEAAISYEHCMAGSFLTTNWKRILELYDWLCRIAPSPVAYLNRVIVVLQFKGPEEAISEFAKIPEVNKLESYYLYYSLAGEIYARLNNKKEAIHHLNKALELTRSNPEKKLLMEKIRVLKANGD